MGGHELSEGIGLNRRHIVKTRKQHCGTYPEAS
jgi:hypothetical protein